jgi:aldose sugar dehydrogenase
MKRIWPAALFLVLPVMALAQQATTAPISTPATSDPVIPERRQAAPVPALFQTRIHEVFMKDCTSCHAISLEAGRGPSLFTDAFLSSHTDEQIVDAVTHGKPGTIMPSFVTLLSPEEMAQIPSYLRIRGGILNRKTGPVPDITGMVFASQKAKFKVQTVVDGLDEPWGMDFLPDGRMIFTERAGRVRFMDKKGKLSEAVKGTPTVFVRQDGGMLDVALDPDFAHNGWIYLSYTTTRPGYVVQPGDDTAPNMGPPTMTEWVRGKVNAKNEWVEQQTIYKAPPEIYTAPADHYGSRFLFDNKGHLFWSMGERHDFQMSQNLASPLGKIHRTNPDGTVPSDNPFLNTPGAMGSVWTYGHRNPEGLAFDPVTGILWETEHGPTGGDEVNIIEPGKDYGWGVATMGLEPGIMRHYAPGMTPPITFYNPSIGPGGITFYTGDKFPAWKNNLFITGMVGQRLIRMEIQDRKIVSQEILFQGYGRVRDVRTGPDGLLYALLQNPAGGSIGGSIIRLTPTK